MSIEEAEAKIRSGSRLRRAGALDQALAEFDAALAACPSQLSPYWHNVALNESEITRGATVLESKPRSLGLTLTNRCNIECIMCPVWNAPFELPERAVREIMEWAPYLERVMWQGGEVFMSRHFEKLFDELSCRKELQQQINTNGLLVSPQWARKLARSNVNLSFSIDGVTKSTYERIRKLGRFERLLEGIERINREKEAFLKESGAPPVLTTTMNVTLMRSNYRELEQFLGFACEHRFRILQINPAGTADDEDIFRVPDLQAWAHIEAVLPRMRLKARALGIIFQVWLPSAPSRPVDQGSPSPSGGKGPEGAKARGAGAPRRPNATNCHWPWQSMFVNNGGSVRLHCFCSQDIGDVGQSSMAELWNNETAQAFRHKLYSNTNAGWCSERCLKGNIGEDSLSLPALT